MKTKTFKCVQCGECMVQADGKPLKDGKQSRTGCVLFHDQRTQRSVRQEPPKGLFHQLKLLFDKKPPS